MQIPKRFYFHSEKTPVKVASSILRRCARGDSLISRESIFLQQLRKSPADCGRYRINSRRDPADVHDIFRPPVFSRRPAPRFHNGNVKRVVDSQRSSLCSPLDKRRPCLPATSIWSGASVKPRARRVAQTRRWSRVTPVTDGRSSGEYSQGLSARPPSSTDNHLATFDGALMRPARDLA